MVAWDMIIFSAPSFHNCVVRDWRSRTSSDFLSAIPPAHSPVRTAFQSYSVATGVDALATSLLQLFERVGEDLSDRIGKAGNYVLAANVIANGQDFAEAVRTVGAPDVDVLALRPQDPDGGAARSWLARRRNSGQWLLLHRRFRPCAPRPHRPLRRHSRRPAAATGNRP